MASEKTRVTHQPKGGMCAACLSAPLNCSTLPFSEMKVIEKCKSSGVLIVKCANFTKV